jgi:hypothetical protein
MVDSTVLRAGDEYGATTKLKPRMLGPFNVLSVPSPVNVMLELPAAMKVHNVVHISRVRPFRSSARFPRTDVSRPGATGRKQGAKVYTLEHIVEASADRQQLRIKWLGWPKTTWEPTSVIRADDPVTVAEFFKAQRASRAASSPAPRSRARK